MYQQSPEEGIWFPNLLVSRKGDVGGVCCSECVGKCTNFCLIWQLFGNYFKNKILVLFSPKEWTNLDQNALFKG